MGFYSKSFRFEGGGRQKIGLKRTGKSCRLRWVNYLHPGLKRGKMTPQEERLVLELHSKWGNRWSRIARKLPGRTDNEIKNYWRTHMRKKAQERKKAVITSSSSSSPSSSSSNCSSLSSSTTNSNSPSGVDSSMFTIDRDQTQTKDNNYSISGTTAGGGGHMLQEQEQSGGGTKVYSMDEIWKDIECSEDDTIKPITDNDGYSEEAAGCNFSGQRSSIMGSPIWDYCPELQWMMEGDYHQEQSKMSQQQLPFDFQYHHYYSFCNNIQETAPLTG